MTAPRRRRSIALAGLGIVGLLMAQACSTETRGSERQGLQRALDDVVRSGVPGVQVVIDGPRGRQVMTAGVGDSETGAAFPGNPYIRIGSNTKTFVSTVMLQLVTEGQVDLNAPVERYLPGVVQGNGNDGNRITVRQLLQHTSGVSDYVVGGSLQALRERNGTKLNPDLDENRWKHYEPADLVRIAMSQPPQFEPGAKSVYTNTNYILAGMLIERITGRTLADEITARILDPLGLHDTYFPAPGDTGLRDPHPRAYHDVDGKSADFTDLDPSWAGAAGAMIATPSDLNRFFTALLGGKLLPAAQLAEMRQTLPLDRSPKDGYGLGLIHLANSCGKEVWGHGGSIPGFEVHTGVTADGTAVVMTVNQLPGSEAAAAATAKAYDTALCGG